MERLLSRIGLRKDVENKVDITLTPEASAYLKQLVLRPNPNLAEFMFLGLGTGNIVEKILVTNEESPIKGQGLVFLEGNKLVSSIDKDELGELLNKLITTEKIEDVLILGHSHPTGVKNFGSYVFYIEPNMSLLEPSMGNPYEGGPTSAADLAVYKDFANSPSFNFPFAGIATTTKSGPKLKIYSIRELIKIKRYNDIDRVSQTTIDL